MAERSPAFPLTFVDWFAGIGGFRLGLERAGMRCVGACEIDPFARQVYAKNFGHEPLFRDIRDVRPSDIPHADLWCGGFPCQDISHASGGHATYLDGTRSGLWWAWRDLIRVVRPRLLLVENVPANLDRWLPAVLGSLAECGYDAEWSVLSARQAGAPHLRRRLFLVAHQGGLAADHAVPDAHQGGLAAVAQPHSSSPPSIEAPHRGDSDGLVWWSTEPPTVRVADGLSRRLDRDRVAALGNSVTPPLVEWIGRRIVSAFDASEVARG